jgi:cytochrome c-type biogenesis protein
LGGRWYIAAGIVAIIMGGQLMGLYELRFPVSFDYRPKQGGIIGSFLLGLFFGVISSPCATPVLVVLLTVVATKGEILYGVALLFTYAIGHCLLMLVAGTFTGFVESLVKAKGVVNFSTWTKRVGGLLVALVGCYLLIQTFR